MERRFPISGLLTPNQPDSATEGESRKYGKPHLRL